MFYPSTKEHVLLFFCLILASNPMFSCSPVLSPQAIPMFSCSSVFPKKHVLMSNYHAYFSYSN